jgi:glycosyltransferase involved in cell wall biosynthesis
MRIAYIANYQSPGLVKKRPCQHNLSLAARVKIQLIAELLQASSHEVDIISQGALEPLVGADRFRFRFYPSFEEHERFHPDIPILYTSALAVKFMTGFWESLLAKRLLKARHDHHRYDAVIIYNLQRAQIGCAHYAAKRLRLPVVLQYEDDAFVNVHGLASNGVLSEYNRRACRKVLKSVSGGTGVSPYLLSQMPSHIPKLLLRGVVSNEILKLSQEHAVSKENWVVFSGTHEGTQGLEQMVKAWRILKLPGWELHIAGQGPLTPALERLAAGDRSIAFHGLLNRQENARMLCAAKIGMNPQDLTSTPGNVFPFKLVEYLAAGAHVISTPRGSLESELEAGVTYVPDNSPETIAECLKRLIGDRRYEKTAQQAAVQIYGPAAVSKSLNNLLAQVSTGKRNGSVVPQAEIPACAVAREDLTARSIAE